MPRRRLARLLLRSGSLLAAVVVLWPALPFASAPKFVTSASPLLAIGSSMATRTVGLAAGIGILFAVMCCLRRRWFCRFICPTGLILDGVAHLGPSRTRSWSSWPAIGKYAALMTLAGACAGYPVFLWLDPLAILSSPFAGVRNPDLISGLLAGILLGILIPSTYVMGTFWCVRVCPLGGLQDLLAILRTPGKAFITNLSGFLKPATGSLARRSFLTAMIAGGLMLGLWGRKAGIARAEAAPLRPPGAVSEDRFTGLCIRCGNCAGVCPAKIIHPDRGRAGVPGLLAPSLRYTDKEFCHEDCKLCTEVCPSGAIQALTLPQKERYIIGEALVDANYCLTTLGKKDCDACVVACPYEAVQLYWDEEMYVAYPVITAAKCNGCGACEAACPTGEIKAISVWPLLLDNSSARSLIPDARFLPPAPSHGTA